MSTAGRRKTKRKSSVEGDAYKEIIDRAADPDETSDDAAATTEEQLRLYQQAEEQIIREGRV